MPAGHRPAVSGHRVVLGVRPESFEDAAFAHGRATIDVGVEVVEDLGSDAHVFFHVEAPPITAEILEAAADSSLLATDRALFAARVDPRSAARPGTTARARGRPDPFPFLRPCDRRAPRDRDGRRRAAGRNVTKQRETRERVLELIEPLAVGESIPSERQLGSDLGVSRLTVRAALDELVREGYLVRRRGAGTFVAEPKVQKGTDVTSFSEDMRTRGLAPAAARSTCEPSRPVPGSGGSCTSRRRSRCCR